MVDRRVPGDSPGISAGIIEANGCAPFVHEPVRAAFPKRSKDPTGLDDTPFKHPGKMDLAFPRLAGSTIGLIVRPIELPIPNKLSKELEFVGQFRVWPRGEQPFKDCSRLRGEVIPKWPHLRPLPDSWIVHDQSLGIDEQIGGKVALQTFVAVDPARSCAGKAGITLLNRADGEIRNGNVGDQEIRALARCER